MATTKGLNVASPQIFQSDPVESVFARGMLEPDRGGLAYALYDAAKYDRSRMQDQYRGDLQQSNALASALQQQEIQAKMLETALKEGHNYLKLGVLPTDMPALGSLFSQPGSESTATPANLQRELLRADIAHKMAQVAASGQAGEPQMTQTLETGGFGPGQLLIQVKGRNEAASGKMLDDAYRRDQIARTGKDPGPNSRLRAGSAPAAQPNMMQRMLGGHAGVTGASE